jgi:hypothetical protein
MIGKVRSMLIFFISKIVKRIGHQSKMKWPYFVLSSIVFFLVHCAQTETKQDLQQQRSISSSTNDASQHRYAYEYCSSERKMYLEDQILRMPPEYTKDHSNEWRETIPMKCIQFAQRNYHGSFGKCQSEDLKPEPTSARPCMTENYVNLTYNAYHDVMDCFNLDPKDFFLQIMIESGFHINAFNKTGFDSGVAQFTGNGIKRIVTDNRIERTRRILLESSRPSCSRIASIVGSFDITSFGVAKRCTMISLPKNPYQGFLFNYLHTMLDQIDLKRQVDDELSSLNEIQAALTDKVKRQLVYLAYNRGMTGIKRLLVGYIENRKKMNQLPTEIDLDLDQNLTRAKKILRLEPEKRELLKKSKIKKLSFAEYAVINKATYVADIVEAQVVVQRYLGNQCSRF